MYLFTDNVISKKHMTEIRLSKGYTLIIASKGLSILNPSWSRILHQKLIVVHIVKKFAVFSGTVFTGDRHWIPSWARCIPSTPTHPMSLSSNLILSHHLCLVPKRFLPFRFSVCLTHLSHVCNMPHTSHPHWSYQSNNSFWIVQMMMPHCSSLQHSVSSCLSDETVLLSGEVYFTIQNLILLTFNFRSMVK